MAANAHFGWLLITFGFLWGAWLGLRFDKPEWLGGYGSLRRRLLRLGHIACFGLGFLNVLYALSAPTLSLLEWRQHAAGWGFVLGGVLMPVTCVLTAIKPRLKPLFVAPVGALVFGGVVLCIGML